MSTPTRDHSITIAEPHYPMLQMLSRHGRWLSVVVAALLIFLVLSNAAQLGLVAIASAAIVAAIGFGAVELAGEIARLLVDTLVPK